MELVKNKTIIIFVLVVLGFIYISATKTAKLDSIEQQKDEYYVTNYK